MLPVNSGGHATYQNFVTENLRKYYPNPNAISRSTWDIIVSFWHLDLSYTDELLHCKYSVFGPKPRTPSCMQRSYLLSIDFKVDSITDWSAQLKINPLYAKLSTLNLETHLVRVPFMISLIGSGTLMKTIFLLTSTLSKRKKLKSKKQNILKLNPLKRLLSLSFFLN